MDSDVAATTNGHSAATSHQHQHSNSASEATTPESESVAKPTLPEHHRLCHVIKRADFHGYGFHLHAEKGKAGQFIGKVDPNSPAEESGLRQGDRIIEVNSVRINHESHKEVVDRIKALEHEVRLLVLDPSQDPTGLALSKKDTSAPVTPPPPSTNGTNGTAAKKKVSADNTDSAQKRSSGSSSSGKAIKNGSNSTATPLQPPTPTKTPASVTVTEAKLDDLNSDLQLSVAEIRAKLANKKKVDPKRESLDLKKKYELVQLL